jgi:hypothetical protein
MSFEIGDLGSTEGPSGTTAAGCGRGDFTSALSAAREARTALRTDAAFPQTPPPEIIEAIDAAAQAYDELTATGQQLHFTVDQPSGALAVELLDLDGNPLTTISASEALRIAGGKSLT